MKLNIRLLLLAGAMCLPALAQFTSFSQPTAAYVTGTSLISLTGTDGTSVSSITDGTQTVTFSAVMSLRTVPTNWSTWGSPPNTESSTPRVLANVTALTSLTLTLSQPAYTFGVEIEPDNYGIYSVTATFMNGSTVLGAITRSVNGASGALLSAASAATPITSVVITLPAAASGLGLAQFRYSLNTSLVTVPALNTSSLCTLGMLLLAVGAMMARRNQRPAATL